MRKLVSFLFISLDGVVESPANYVRSELYQDFPDLPLSEQDTVLMGRKLYEEWAPFWPSSDIEPFASFINSTPKHVVSSTLQTLDWEGSSLISGDVMKSVAEMKNREGKTIGVHGSITLIQSLLLEGLIDELHFYQIPAIAGSGRHLMDHAGSPIQLDLKSSQRTPLGVQYLIYTPRPLST